MKLLSLFLLLLVYQASEAQVDLTQFDQIHVRVSTPDDTKFATEKGYLSGLLISYLRGTNAFHRVHAATELTAQGVLLEVDITHLRVIGSTTRFFAGALSGKDKLAAKVRFRDLSTGTVIVETVVDGGGTRGFLWNIGGASIYSAMSNFAGSIVEWAGYGSPIFGEPLDWGGKIGSEYPVAVSCTGISRKTTGIFVRYKQSNESVCKALQQQLESIGVEVAEESPHVLHLSLVAGVTAGMKNKFEPVLIMRWLIKGPDGVVHDGVIASNGPVAKRKGGRNSAAEAVLMQVRIGTNALWSH